MHHHFSYWQFSTTDGLILVLLTMSYFYLVKFRISKRVVFFTSALLLVVLCMYSPLHVVGAHKLFSVHMICHIVLLLLAAPLFIASIPLEPRRAKAMRQLSDWSVRYPFAFWIVGVGIMWFWHIPWIFNALFHAMHSTHAHGWMVLHLWSLVGAGIVFYWPLLHPYKVYRLSALNSILYLSSACLFCSLLGLFITFAPVGLYTSHLHYPVSFEGWNISALADQQMAGLIMWVPCCFIYLSISMILLIRWLSQDEQHHFPFTKHTVYEQEHD